MDESNELLYYTRSQIKIQMKDFKGAEKDLKLVLEYNPDYGFAYYHLGIIKAQTGDNKSAINLFDKSLSFISNDQNSLYQRGLAKQKIGDKSGACIDVKKAGDLGHLLSQDWLSKYCK